LCLTVAQEGLSCRFMNIVAKPVMPNLRSLFSAPTRQLDARSATRTGQRSSCRVSAWGDRTAHRRASPARPVAVAVHPHPAQAANSLSNNQCSREFLLAFSKTVSQFAHALCHESVQKLYYRIPKGSLNLGENKQAFHGLIIVLFKALRINHCKKYLIFNGLCGHIMFFPACFYVYALSYFCIDWIEWKG
jgi:hypothetical protein